MMQPQPVPMGPPMGGPMGPPPAQPPQMPMGPQAGPQQVQGQQGQQVTGYGGSARGRANFKQYMQTRKQVAQQKSMFPQMARPAMPAPMANPMMGQQMAPQMMGPQPMGPMPMGQQGPLVGRQVPGGPMVGSAPVQMQQGPMRMMGGGVVPLFGGLGRY